MSGELLARVHVRCANEACNQTWWEGPKNGRTVIGKCPSCSHSTVVVLAVDAAKEEEDLRDGACNADYVFSDTKGDVRCRCSKNRGHVGEHGALYGPCKLCDNGKNVQQPFNKPCPDCGRYWEARCDAQTTGRLGVHDHVGMALVCRKVKNHPGAHEWEPVSASFTHGTPGAHLGEPARVFVSSETVDENTARARRMRANALLVKIEEHRNDLAFEDRIRPVEHALEQEWVYGRDAVRATEIAESHAYNRNKFLGELEKHRGLVNAIAEQEICNPEIRALARAVWFLLAVAHQP